jgi:hypothetical protein
MEKKKLRRKCELGYDGCVGVGNVNEDVFYMIEPYRQDVHGEEIKMWLCLHCTRISADEI